MGKYPPSVLEMLKQEEGYVGLNDQTRKSAHKATTTDYGAYYDARGYLTTGFGSLISKQKKGSEEELADINRWRANAKADPFTLTEDQANSILPIDIDRVTQRAKKQLGDDIEFETLPEQAQQAVVSLAYNAGQIGTNTAAAIRKAALSKSTSAWQAAARKVENWHGKLASEQPEGVLNRRKKEASLLASIQGLTPEGSASEAINAPFAWEQGEIPDGELPDAMVENIVGSGVDIGIESVDTPLNTRDPATPEESFLLEKEQLPPAGAKIQGQPYPPEIPSFTQSNPKGAGGSDIGNDGLYEHPELALSGTGFSRIAFDEKQSDFEKAQIEENKPWQTQVGEFKDNLANALMTENIIGTTVRKATLVWNQENVYTPGFDATQLPDYQDIIKNLPQENLKDILNDSYTPQMFYGRVNNYQAEVEARQQVSAYMQANPVAGFIGIGIASVADVTSLIPMGKLANVVGLTRATKTIPIMMRTIGAGIAENVAQDLIQESLLVNNSDIRKFSDGDIVFGAAAAAILGGVAGTFKYSKGLAKYEKLAGKYAAEKNLNQMEVMIRNAQKRGYSPKVIAELQQTRKFIEQSLDGEHRAMILKEINNQQDAIGRGLLDTKKIESVKELDDYNKLADSKIAEIRAQAPQAITDVKVAQKEARAPIIAEMDSIREQNVGLKRRIRQIETNPGTGERGLERAKNLRDTVAANDAKIEGFNKQLRQQAKEFRGTKNKAVKEVKKLEATGENPLIREWEESKQVKADELKYQYRDLEQSVLNRTHPELSVISEPDSVNAIAEALGLGHLKFGSADEIDRFLGLEFEDSFKGPAGGFDAGAAKTKYDGFAKGGSTDQFFNKTDPELWNVMSESAYQAKVNPGLGLSSHQVNKNSVAARILRTTRLNELLTTDSVAGRWILNKSALRSTDNEFAAGFYNLFAPDGVGRVGEGRFSVIEKQQQLSNIYGGTLRTKMNTSINEINALAIENDGLRTFLGLPENPLMAKVQMAEVGHIEKVSEILRDELITPGTARQAFGDDIGNIVDKMRKDFNENSASILAHAKEAGVKGVEEIDNSMDTSDWFHRTWDNQAVRQMRAQFGEEKLIELVENSMTKHLANAGIEVSEEVAEQLKEQAKKFAFGIFNSDLEVNKTAKLSASDFINDLINKNLEGLDPEVLTAEAKRLDDRAAGAKARELGKRKPLNLDGSVEILDDDGKVTNTIFMKDLLEKNLFVSQKGYIETMSARIAAAENGIKDIDLLDQWANNAHELEMARGKVDSAQYIKRAMAEDIRAFKYGSSGVSGEFDNGSSRLLRMSKKYQFAKLMQYTGISSIAEMATLIPEAGYKAVAQSLNGELTNIFKSTILGGVTGKQFTNKMYEGLASITGVGIEDIGYDSLISSSRTIATSPAGKVAERFVDNAAKATRRATAHVETIGRRIAVNSLALNFGDIAFNRSQLDNVIAGGLTNRNLVELGLASLDEVTGKAIPNAKYESILESIRKHALDENGLKVSETGGNIKDFNIHDWDLKTRRSFGDALTQQANHIMVNPDSTTAKLWHSTPVGSIFNQFRTFSNNAASKVAGHNVNQAIQGYKMGSMAEFSKTAQKYFWGAALGKLSLMLYGAIDNAGRPDFSQRMEKYTHMNDPRDWTQALGRSSAVTGLDEVLDTTMGAFGQDPLFNASTIGQSRNRFDLMQTPTGQMLTDAKRTGGYVMEGKYKKAGKTALKMSPIRRQIGVNQLLNSMGVD